MRLTGESARAKELFEEVLAGYPVVENEDTAVFAALNCPDDTTEIKSQFLNGEIDDEDQCCNQAECLQGICPDDCLYTAFMGVYPY